VVIILGLSRVCEIPHTEGLVPGVVPNEICTFHYLVQYLVDDLLIRLRAALQLLRFIGKRARICHGLDQSHYFDVSLILGGSDLKEHQSESIQIKASSRTLYATETTPHANLIQG
jgi:hypothetical protein